MLKKAQCDGTQAILVSLPDKRSSDLLRLTDIGTSFSAALKKRVSPVTLLDSHVIQNVKQWYIWPAGILILGIT